MSKVVSTELSYKQLLATIKQQVQSAQVKPPLAVNSSLIQLYWNMGKQDDCRKPGPVWRPEQL